jgi:hypothetical protein
MAPPGTSAETLQAQDDKLIQQTDNDASVSRFSAVKLGYLHDSYAREFVIRDNTPRRLPIINRGDINLIVCRIKLIQSKAPMSELLPLTSWLRPSLPRTRAQRLKLYL